MIPSPLAERKAGEVKVEDGRGPRPDGVARVYPGIGGEVGVVLGQEVNHAALDFVVHHGAGSVLAWRVGG